MSEFLYRIYLIIYCFKRNHVKSDIEPKTTSIMNLTITIFSVVLTIYALIKILFPQDVEFYPLIAFLPLILYLPFKFLIENKEESNDKIINLDLNENEIKLYGILLIWLPLPLIIASGIFLAIS